MQIFVGTLITTISILIIGFLIWYNHFYMIAFGRGLPEALFYQRMIATLIPSAPFIVFIYLVFKHPIFGNNDEKETPVKKKWSLALIAIGFVCVCILWPWPSGALINVYFYETQAGAMMACSTMESDAHSTFAAISSYYSYPDNIELPSVEQLIEEEGLHIYYSVTIQGDPEKDIFVTVIDDSAKCPKGKKLVAHLGEGEPEWKD